MTPAETHRGPRVHAVDREDVLRHARKFAALLDALGVDQRATVALLGGNTPHFMWALRGATWSGRKVVPLSWRWTAEDIDYVLGDSRATVLVADAAHASLVGAAHLPSGAIRFAMNGEIEGFRSLEAELSTQPDHPDILDLAGDIMPYTSGTTGRPKGVVRPTQDGPPPTFSALRGAAMLERTPGAADGPHLVCTPIYHAAPLFYSDGALLLGTDLVLMEKFDPEGLLAAIEEHQVASVFMVPTQFVRLLALPQEVRDRHDLSSLRLVVHGSAPVAPTVKEAMIAWFGPVLYEFYGGSEGGGSTGISSTEWLAHRGSVGKVVSGSAIRILDEDGNELPPHTEGQVWFDGGQEWSYRDAPEKTQRARRGSMSTLGDIGYLDEEGYLYLCDRRTDLILTGGMNVYPNQVENAFAGHPGIADICVVGVSDAEWGQRVTAVVELRPGWEPDESTREALTRHARERLASYQAPKRIEFVTALPRTETGKLSRLAVRESLEDRTNA
ncbi:AMP-binding protein [Nocardioides sp. AE5]|uniref:AMP-binding protein n=1 Tax=Nocardioides sp. AE5 TaxID=2962573 RepID=UPI002881568E|nr:AMP-binding protein [Nocardioides sp. AE5]MDT0203225.1 AMP-binding protein [Nocardioides sp. AE5]